MDCRYAWLWRLCVAVLTAIACSLGLASPAAAQAEPPCSQDQEAAIGFYGYPHRIVVGRWYEFGLGGYGPPYVHGETAEVTMTQDGVAFFREQVRSYNYAEEPPQFRVRADPGDRSIVFTAKYPEATYDESNDGELHVTSICERMVVAEVRPHVGRRMPPVKVSARGSRAQFLLARVSRCWGRFALTPLSLRLKADGARRWSVLKSSDQCDGWDSYASRGRGFRTRGNDDAYRRLVFEPITPRRTGVASVRFEIRSRGKLLRRGRLRVTTVHKPAVRVYAFHPNGAINDWYWNYCVNEGMTVWMDRGNPYCIEPSSTRRTVAVRK